MSRFLIILIVSVCITLSVRAQDWHKLDSLRKALPTTQPDTARISLLLKLAEFEIFKPGEFKTDLDSAADYISRARLVNKKINSIEAEGDISLSESYLAKERGRKTQGKALVEKAIQILSKGTDRYQLGRAYFALAEYYNLDDPAEMPKRMQLIEQAARIFKQGGYVERAAYGYKMLGELADDSTTLRYLNRSLALYRSIHYRELQGLYDLFGVVYLYRTDFGQALDYELKALKIAEDVRDTSMQLCEINNHIGIIYYKLLDIEKAIIYFKAALRTAEAFKDVQTIYFLTTNITNAYQRLGKPRQVLNMLDAILKKHPMQPAAAAADNKFACSYLRAYTALEEFDQARPYSDHLLRVSKNNQIDKSSLSDIYAALISYFFASKQYSQELIYLIKNDALTRQLGISTNISINNNMWFKLDTAQKNYKAAVYHLLKHKQINDSTYTVIKNKEIQRLQIEYDTKKKEDRIKFLNEEAALYQSNLQQANLLKNLTIGGIVLVLIIAGLLYRQNRLKQKNNEVITHKNEVITHKNELLQNLVAEKEWLLKEVHHRVKNNLHTVICLLESQAAYLDSAALQAIQTSQHRIYTMSLIHQALYQSDDIKMIQMDHFIPKLVYYLADSFGVADKIHIGLHIDAISLNPAQAIPLALIINEALTNSMKYAFPGKRKGEVLISLTDAADEIVLELSDNGVGLNEGVKSGITDSLGFALMKGLAKEMRGKIRFENKKGLRIIVAFRYDVLNDISSFQEFAGTELI